MQALRTAMNEDNQWIHLSMFNSRNQHPRTLDKLDRLLNRNKRKHRDQF